jgi:hypothetical protein
MAAVFLIVVMVGILGLFLGAVMAAVFSIVVMLGILGLVLGVVMVAGFEVVQLCKVLGVIMDALSDLQAVSVLAALGFPAVFLRVRKTLENIRYDTRIR